MESAVAQKSINLTTTNNFKLEESLMQKVFESSGYKLTIVTPNDSEPHFIAKELAKALVYLVASNFVRSFRNNGLNTLTLTKENRLNDLKLELKNNRSSIHKFSSRLVLLPSGSLQEYLVKHSTKPEAKEIGKKLYEILASSNPVFKEEVLDDWQTSLEELTLTVPQLFDASKKVNGFIFDLVKNDRIARRFVQAYHNTTMKYFIFGVNRAMRDFKKLGLANSSKF